MRDTLIGDRLARIIGVTSGGVYYPESEVPFYEKGGKMYFYEEDDWRLLYDFTAEVGDTVEYSISGKYAFYNLLQVIEGVDRIKYEQFVIMAIDTIYTASGIPLKRFRTQVDTDWNQMEYIIERVGSINHLFGKPLIPVTYGCRYNSAPAMRCFSDGDIHLKFTNEDCDMITAVTDVQYGDVVVNPNPAYDRLEVVLPDNIWLRVCMLS